LQNPVTIGTLSGLFAGLLFSVVILIKTRVYRNELEDEIADARYDFRRLEEQLNTQMRVSAKAQDELQRSLEAANATIQKLETSLGQSQQKPGRKELRQLAIMLRAVEILAERAPGYQLAWEQAIAEAEAQIRDSEKGIIPLLRKVFPGESA
jgi:septal ring factor EnvC (AmiA/AmiB activator)